MLTPELDRRLSEQEADPFHPESARLALEEALIYQFRNLARGLFADMILRKGEASGKQWWSQYASELDCSPTEPDAKVANLLLLVDSQMQMPEMWDIPLMGEDGAEVFFHSLSQIRRETHLEKNLSLETDTPDFQAYRKQFTQGVALRRAPRVSREDLREVRIRIFGGEVPLWHEGRINRQLRDLGSSFRYWMPGSARMRIHESRVLVGESNVSEDIPLKFLFGEAEPPSAIGKVLTFIFTREFAVSPYLEESVGHREGSRVVVRRSLPHSLLHVMISPLGHELGHIADKDLDPQGGLPSVRAVLRDDLCCYCRQPRSLAEIAFDFSEAICSACFFSNWPGMFPPRETAEVYRLSTLLNELIRDGLLTRTDEGNYLCPLFLEGRRWHLA
jgi:hypothetical protein